LAFPKAGKSEATTPGGHALRVDFVRLHTHKIYFYEFAIKYVVIFTGLKTENILKFTLEALGHGPYSRHQFCNR
jgi:hypothetical protein